MAVNPMKKNKKQLRPSVKELETELRRVKYRRRYGSVLRSTVYALITVAAVAVLVATLWLPVLQIYGSSMTPTLQDGEIIFSVKTAATLIIMSVTKRPVLLTRHPSFSAKELTT